VKDAADRLLTGSRAVPILAVNATSAGAVNVTIPSATPLGSYFLLACSDDTKTVVEKDETNNCRASITKIAVTGP